MKVLRSEGGGQVSCVGGHQDEGEHVPHARQEPGGQGSREKGGGHD